ncbi:MAG: polysaccharide ABC transporter ATP-binding protein [Victivallaceae bacterium]|nr:polysaccharide ABC transporter ATP-binding protein [Victivallaceae bacterium]
MGNTIIKIENLSKKYIIGHDRDAQGAFQYHSLRDNLMHHARGIYQRLRHPLQVNRENTELEEFWALKDINLEIKQGDRIGIIGRNGAGKSTLLKILSRITEPTTGKITIAGRVASLLEVGTGFHPELNGRENIYLNGAILGMTRLEIKKKFDEIVAFAEVEKFLDTPVKRYSSGMYVRLAFAVAAHLEPEILLVDEVLAVGDAQFQKKCLGKMEDMSGEGRTVFFVSHNMLNIRQLCNQGILLNSGEIVLNSDVSTVVDNYLYSSLPTNRNDKNSSQAHIKDVKILSLVNNNFQPFLSRFKLSITLYTPHGISNAAISYQIIDSSGKTLIYNLLHSSEQEFCHIPGEFTVESVIPVLHLYPNSYFINVFFANSDIRVRLDKLLNCCHFTVPFPEETRTYYWRKDDAVYIEKNKWSCRHVSQK